MEINFSAKEKIEEMVRRTQAVINTLETSNGELNKLINKNVLMVKERDKHIGQLTKTCIDLTQTIKSIHILLNAKKDLWEKDEDMCELIKQLSIFVLSSASIKMGVKQIIVEQQKHIEKLLHVDENIVKFISTDDEH